MYSFSVSVFPANIVKVSVCNNVFRVYRKAGSAQSHLSFLQCWEWAFTFLPCIQINSYFFLIWGNGMGRNAQLAWQAGWQGESLFSLYVISLTEERYLWKSKFYYFLWFCFSWTHKKNYIVKKMGNRPKRLVREAKMGILRIHILTSKCKVSEMDCFCLYKNPKIWARKSWHKI